MAHQMSMEPVEADEILAPSDNTLRDIVSAEIDCQIATAKRFPRSLAKATKKLTEIVTLNPDVAEECQYAKPIGKGKKAFGASIRFAEALAASYGNMRAGGRVIDVGHTMLTAQGICHDLESNSVTTKEVRRRITYADGSRYNDNMIMQTANAAISIALRNAILANVPKSFWWGPYEQSQKVARGDAKTLESRRKDAVIYCRGLGVDVGRVCAAVGVKGLEDIGLDELMVLVGLVNSIKSEEVTVEEAFPEPAGGEKDSSPPKPRKTKKDATTAASGDSGGSEPEDASEEADEAPPLGSMSFD